MSLRHATYVGPLEHLKGEGALLRRADEGFVLAQFDKPSLTRSGNAIVLDEVRELTEPPADALGFGWHAFPKDHFKMGHQP